MLQNEEIKTFIENHKRSEFYKQAQTGVDYYNGEHEIKSYTPMYYDTDGILQVDTYRSNVTISHPFFRELVEQATNFLMSGKGRLVESDYPDLNQALDYYFGDGFKQQLRELLTGIQKEGSGYMYQYMDADGKSAFQYAVAMNTFEVPAKIASDNRDYVIRFYIDFEKDEEGKLSEAMRIEVWDDKATYYFINRGQEIEVDDTVAINPRPHILFQEGERLFYDVFDTIPFFRVDNDENRESDIHKTKELIDDYDRMACSLTNDLQDFASAIYLVKGYQGTNLEELQTNLKTKKIVGVGENGGLDAVTIDIPYEARKIKLELDERNIYKFGFGFNTSQIGDGNITNVVIKSRYALLDLKCNRLEANLRRLLLELAEIAINEINKEISGEYSVGDVRINFERNIISNDADNATIEKTLADKQQVRVNTLLSLTSILGEQKVLELIGEELDIDVSEVNVESLQQATLDLNQASESLLYEGE